MHAILFLVGLVLLLFGSRGVVANSLRIAKLLKVSPLVIGITLVAIGSSLPEMVVSLFGSLDKAPGLALGNIIGSNIANIGLVFALSLFMTPVYVGAHKTQQNMIVVSVLTLFLLISIFLTGITPLHGLLFIFLGFGMIWWQIHQGQHDKSYEKPTEKIIPRKPLITAILFFLSLIVLLAGGKLLVDEGIGLAESLGIAPAIIGISAVAVGTSLPEVSIAITGLLHHGTKNRERLVVGTIIGSNIYNILFGVGILGLFGVQHFVNTYSLMALFLFTLMFSYLLYRYRGRYVPRIVGPFLLLFYITYLYFLFTAFS